jgi:hypothetical protein
MKKGNCMRVLAVAYSRAGCGVGYIEKEEEEATFLSNIDDATAVLSFTPYMAVVYSQSLFHPPTLILQQLHNVVSAVRDCRPESGRKTPVSSARLPKQRNRKEL